MPVASSLGATRAQHDVALDFIPSLSQSPLSISTNQESERSMPRTPGRCQQVLLTDKVNRPIGGLRAHRQPDSQENPVATPTNSFAASNNPSSSNPFASTWDMHPPDPSPLVDQQACLPPPVLTHPKDSDTSGPAQERAVSDPESSPSAAACSSGHCSTISLDVLLHGSHFSSVGIRSPPDRRMTKRTRLKHSQPQARYDDDIQHREGNTFSPDHQGSSGTKRVHFLSPSPKRL
ncbi:hypothetical protein BGZ63DRAFT_431564 [Mariannaea sp. PMI_226]|nr:hypothetical protein BGZ63DRAFT_431564 [Mariannaea sp. PMI_226]